METATKVPDTVPTVFSAVRSGVTSVLLCIAQSKRIESIEFLL